MKILGVIKKIFIGVVAIVFFSIAITLTVLLLNFNDYGVTQIDNTSLIFINGEISSNNYKKGDLVFVEGKKIDSINVGDEIFAYKVDDAGKVSIELGTVGKLHLEEDAISFENGSTFSMEFVVGKASKVYNKVGTYLSILESRWGFLFIILVPSFLILIYEFYALIVEIKYGKDDELISQ